MNYVYYFGILVLAEITLAFVFSILIQIIYKKQAISIWRPWESIQTILNETIAGRKNRKERASGFHPVMKGIVERGFLVIALVNDYPHALTLFSALKLGTRLKHKDTDPTAEDDFNDFYLIGNLISVSVAIGYTVLFRHMMK